MQPLGPIYVNEVRVEPMRSDETAINLVFGTAAQQDAQVLVILSPSACADLKRILGT